MSRSNFSDRIAFFKDNSQVNIMPELHLNLVNMMGISVKSEYLIWREKGGLFSAFHRCGQIQTWSIATGNKLYNMKIPMNGLDFKNF